MHTHTASETLTTKAGTVYEILQPAHKYRVKRVALYHIPARYEMDLSGRDSVRLSTADGTRDLVLLQPRLLSIFPYYCWDGPSGAIDNDAFMDGSLAHDPLCQLIDLGIIAPWNQPAADGFMRHVNLANGMSHFRAWYTWRAVRAYRSRVVRDMPWPRT